MKGVTAATNGGICAGCGQAKHTHPPLFLFETLPCRRPPPAQRLVITNLLINAFRCVLAKTPADLLPVVYLCTNRVAPAHEGVELGIGDATLIKVRLRWQRAGE